MRSRKALIIAGLLVAWTFFTYYFLLRNNYELTMDKGENLKLQQLEKRARMEYAKSGRLMTNLKEFIKSKFKSTEDEGESERLDEAEGPAAPAPLKPAESPPESQGVLPLPLAPDKSQEHKAVDDTRAGFGVGVGESPEHQIAGDLEQSNHQEAATTQTLTHLPNGQPVIPIVVFSCNRVSISKCLDNLIQYRPNPQQFPIIVSQDCRDVATRNVILSYKSQVELIEQPDQSEIYVPPREKKFAGYYKIARHYGWALNTTFHRGYEFAVIVEDDLNVAPDFYEYFLGTYPLLQKDPSLWCISAWNDNGKANFIDTNHPELLYRTDFFPGLGWMLTKDLWQELSVKWPKSFWDDWIRHPEQRKDRVCIRPEIPRTRTFGKIGVSNGLFFDKHLKHIKLSDQFVPFSQMNLSYLLKDNYDRTFLKEVYTLPIVTYDELRRKLISKDGPVRIQYTSREQYKHTTKMLGLMDDFKSGVPRTAYHGIVSFYYNDRRVHLAPNLNWKGYDPSWS